MMTKLFFFQLYRIHIYESFKNGIFIEPSFKPEKWWIFRKYLIKNKNNK